MISLLLYTLAYSSKHRESDNPYITPYRNLFSKIKGEQVSKIELKRTTSFQALLVDEKNQQFLTLYFSKLPESLISFSDTYPDGKSRFASDINKKQHWSNFTELLNWYNDQITTILDRMENGDEWMKVEVKEDFRATFAPEKFGESQESQLKEFESIDDIQRVESIEDLTKVNRGKEYQHKIVKQESISEISSNVDEEVPQFGQLEKPENKKNKKLERRSSLPYKKEDYFEIDNVGSHMSLDHLDLYKSGTSSKKVEQISMIEPEYPESFPNLKKQNKEEIIQFRQDPQFIVDENMRGTFGGSDHKKTGIWNLPEEESKGDSFNMENRFAFDSDQLPISKLTGDLSTWSFPYGGINLPHDAHRLFELIGEIGALFKSPHSSVEIVNDICVLRSFFHNQYKKSVEYINTIDSLFVTISRLLSLNHMNDKSPTIVFITMLFGKIKQDLLGEIETINNYSNTQTNIDRFTMLCDGIESKYSKSLVNGITDSIWMNFQKVILGSNLDSIWMTRLPFFPVSPWTEDIYYPEYNRKMQELINLSKNAITQRNADVILKHKGITILDYELFIEKYVNSSIRNEEHPTQFTVSSGFFKTTYTPYNLYKFYDYYLSLLVRKMEDSGILANGVSHVYNGVMGARNVNFKPLSINKNAIKNFIDILPQFFKIFPTGKTFCSVMKVYRSTDVTEVPLTNALISIIFYMYAMYEKIDQDESIDPEVFKYDLIDIDWEKDLYRHVTFPLHHAKHSEFYLWLYPEYRETPNPPELKKMENLHRLSRLDIGFCDKIYPTTNWKLIEDPLLQEPENQRMADIYLNNVSAIAKEKIDWFKCAIDHNSKMKGKKNKPTGSDQFCRKSEDSF